MPNLCEECPIPKKIGFCCSSNPETGATREVLLKRSLQVITVCDQLQNDGSCGIYNERPEACASYACEELYAMGLGAQRE